MKKLLIVFAMLLGSLEAFSQSTTLLPFQANNPSGIMPPNLLYVDPVTYRIWPVKSDSLKMGYQSIRWLNDSVIVIGDRRWVKLAGSYPNPSFISSIASSKVTGLSTVATTGDYADLLNKPNLSVYETTSHAASTFYPISNPSGFISSYTPDTSVYRTTANSLTLSQSQTKLNTKFNIPTGTTLQYLNGLGTPVTFPTIPAQYNPTAGTGISITGSYPNMTYSNTLPDQTVSLTGANGLVASGTYPNFTLTQYIPTVNSAVTRPINSTTFTVSSTRQAFVTYNVTISCTATIGSASTGSIALQYSINAGSTWITVGTVSNSNTVTLAVVLNSVQISGGQVSGYVPANALVRLVPTTSGTTALTYLTGQETY